MSGQRIIDPTDPQSMMRLLDRVTKLEQTSNQLSGQLKRTRKTVKEIAARKGQGTSNVQFTSTDGTHITYTSGYVVDEAGVTHQVIGSVLAAVGVTGGGNFYMVYNPSHTQMLTLTSASVLTAMLKNPGCLHVATCQWTLPAITYPTVPNSPYPLGTSFTNNAG